MSRKKCWTAWLEHEKDDQNILKRPGKHVQRVFVMNSCPPPRPPLITSNSPGQVLPFPQAEYKGGYRVAYLIRRERSLSPAFLAVIDSQPVVGGHYNHH